ncbi:MAG: hypothetical protein ACR2QB_03050 [Gammaproteobacteria bacterium]
MSKHSQDFMPAQAHGAIESLGHDVWWVPGTMRMNRWMGVSRNMVIVRTGDELTLLNPIRLDAAGEQQLEKLGRVRHLVRLGCFHGCDDAYLKQRFKAEFWCQADSRAYPQPAPDHLLAEGAPVPVADGQLLVFKTVKRPECALLIRRGHGILVTCDSLQHYTSWQRHSLIARLVMPLMGFSRRLLVGPLWLKFQTPEGESVRPDFEALLKLDFDTLISAHGVPLMQDAKNQARAAVESAFAD